MGQTHIVANLDRHEFLNPRTFHDGGKVPEYARNEGGTLSALGMLVYGSHYDGGGGYYRIVHLKRGTTPKVPDGWRIAYTDFSFPDVEQGVAVLVPKMVGRWAGNRIVVIGDYIAKNKWWKQAGLNRIACAKQWRARKLTELRQEVKDPAQRLERETEAQSFERRRSAFAPDRCDLYDYATTHWQDISAPTLKALQDLGLARAISRTDPYTEETPSRPERA